jgi:hypothetical protein
MSIQNASLTRQRNPIAIACQFLIRNIKINYLFIFLFAYTAISKLQLFTYTNNVFKLVDLTQFKEAMSKSQPLKLHINYLAYIIPLSELLVCALLLFNRTKKIGYYASFALMAVFTGYVAYILLKYPDFQRPCVCGGVISLMNWPQHLAFNLLFTFLAARAIYLMRRDKALA